MNQSHPVLTLVVALLIVTPLLSSVAVAEVRAGPPASRTLAQGFAGSTWQAIRFMTNARSYSIAIGYAHPNASAAYEVFLYDATGERIDGGGIVYAHAHAGVFVGTMVGGSQRATDAWAPANGSELGTGGSWNGTLDGSGTYTLVVFAAGPGVVPWNYTFTMDQAATVLGTTEGNSTGFYGASAFHGGGNVMVRYGTVGARVEKSTRLDVRAQGMLIEEAFPGTSGQDNLTMVTPNGTEQRCYCGTEAISGPGAHGPGIYEFGLSGLEYGTGDIEDVQVMYADITLPS